MRSREFIVEKTVGKISKRAQQPSVGINTFGDHERMNSDYTAYRLGLAMACSNGCDPLDVDYKSWYGKKKTVHPYTALEQEMFKQAAEAMGADYEDINHGNMASEELETTNTVSPISNWMNKK
jgi:hypothetical protein